MGFPLVISILLITSFLEMSYNFMLCRNHLARKALVEAAADKQYIDPLEAEDFALIKPYLEAFVALEGSSHYLTHLSSDPLFKTHVAGAEICIALSRSSTSSFHQHLAPLIALFQENPSSHGVKISLAYSTGTDQSAQSLTYADNIYNLHGWIRVLDTNFSNIQNVLNNLPAQSTANYHPIDAAHSECLAPTATNAHQVTDGINDYNTPNSHKVIVFITDNPGMDAPSLTTACSAAKQSGIKIAVVAVDNGMSTALFNACQNCASRSELFVKIDSITSDNVGFAVDHLSQTLLPRLPY